MNHSVKCVAYVLQGFISDHNTLLSLKRMKAKPLAEDPMEKKLIESGMTLQSDRFR